MDSAVFFLWLDSIFCKDEDELFIVRFMKTTSLDGDGVPSSLIIAGDGHTQVNTEHSWGDGGPVLPFINEVYRNSTGHPDLPLQVEGALAQLRTHKS